MGRVRTYHYSTRLTDRGPGRPGWAGLWSVEYQWSRVTDVVLQYEVHREAVGPPLPSGMVMNHNNDQYSGPNISLSQKSHVSLLAFREAKFWSFSLTYFVAIKTVSHYCASV